MQSQTARLESFPDAEIADTLDLLGMEISTGDFVMQSSSMQLGRVLACGLERNSPILIVEIFDCVLKTSTNSGNYDGTEVKKVWSAETVEQAILQYCEDMWRPLPESHSSRYASGYIYIYIYQHI